MLIAIGFPHFAIADVPLQDVGHGVAGEQFVLDAAGDFGHGRDHMAQYLPFALLLMFLIEQGGAPPWLLYVLGLLLVAGYALHLWGFAQYPGNYKTPAIGTILISLVYGIACLVGLGQALGVA